MAGPVTSPYAVLAGDLESIINAEFSDEGWAAEHDNLHDSLGHEGTRIGIAPARENPMYGNAVVNEVTIQVKFLGAYDREIDPEQAVDPRIVAEYAERFRRALQSNQTEYEGSAQVWYFDVIAVDYPNDPTGNKTRFFATVVAKGNNSGLIETAG